MIGLNIPLLMVVVAFFLLTLGVGMYCSGKAVSLRAYAVGHEYSLAVSMSTRVDQSASSLGPIQAKRAFFYAAFFSFVRTGCMMWNHIMSNIPPIYKGFIAIGLIAMAMSTVEACLHSCSVAVSHDVALLKKGFIAVCSPIHRLFIRFSRPLSVSPAFRKRLDRARRGNAHLWLMELL